MDEKKLEEMLRILEEQGCSPKICDTPVPYFSNGVPAGFPDNPGDYDGEYEMIPRAMLKDCDFIVAVHGDSMIDVGINDGDDVIVKKMGSYSDGDIVVACLDGKTTLKTIIREPDETWLVPANEKYEAFPLSNYSSVYILGKVTRISRHEPKASFAEVQKRIKQAKEKMRKVVDDETVVMSIEAILPKINTNRKWFAIYRVLADANYLPKRNYEAFRTKINELFPANNFTINPSDLSKLDIDSFAKPIDLWNEFRAPVSGKRFRDYLALGLAFRNMIYG